MSVSSKRNSGWICKCFPPKFLHVSQAFEWTEPGRCRRDYNRLTHGHQIQRAKRKSTMLNDKRIKTCIDKFAAGVYSRYKFLSAVSHMADNRPTAQLEDLSSSDDDTETYDVDEALAATTSTSSALGVSTIWCCRAASSDCRSCSLQSMSNWAQGCTGTSSMWTFPLL